MGPSNGEVRMAADTAGLGDEQRLSRVQSLAGVGLAEWWPRTGAMRWSPQLRAMFGFADRDRLDLHTFRSLIHPEDRAAVEQTLGAALDGDPAFRSIHRMLLADRRTVRVFAVNGEVLADAADGPLADGPLVVATVLDITEHQEAKNDLAFLAAHDPVTGVLNRRSIIAAVSERLAHYADPGALVILDIDHFNDVNDLRGHTTGDGAMRALTTLLQRLLPDDALLGRLGSDEFAVLLPGADLDEAVDTAERLCDTVHATPFLTADEPLRLSVSLGVASIDADDVETVLAHADLALQEAKRTGRNRTCRYSSDQRVRARRRLSVQQRLVAALDDDGFALFAQPIIDLRTDQVSAFELLLRLDDGRVPDLPPREFLATAERSTLAPRIDRWVVRRAVSVLASPRARRRGLRLQANLTGRTLEDAEFCDELLEDLKAAGVDPYRLGLEVTETTAVRDVDRVLQLADRLGEAGCPVVLDDFGSGFGSLLSLHRVPFAAVKVSGPLVREADRSSRHRAVVEGIVRLAHGMGMQVIAEEVDRQPLLDALLDAGVRAAQGFLLGAPQPLDRVLETHG